MFSFFWPLCHVCQHHNGGVETKVSHDAHDLLDQSSKFDWLENPLVRTNQIQEDFIGRPSRLSRRVSTRSLPNSVMLRALIIYEESLKAAMCDSRGLDAYPN